MPVNADATRADSNNLGTAGPRPRKNPRRATAAEAPAATPSPTTDVTKPTGNECLCGCGAPVKRRYRPGHDARYVSQQAQVFVAATPDDRSAILDRLEKELSPALMAKWLARVDRLTVNDQKVYQSRTAQVGRANTKKEN